MPKKKQPKPSAFRSLQRNVRSFNPVKLTQRLWDALWDPSHILWFFGVLFVMEIVVIFFAIKVRPYTEIDWTTYMQQVDVFVAGERYYPNIKGDTGICPYPAGFLYLYSLFSWLSGGGDIRMGQYIFAILYLCNISFVALIYRKCGDIPPIALVIVICTSYRLHSIFILRLFNDALTVTLLHASLLLMLNRRWVMASLMYSISLSVKMNVLLLLPAFGAILCISVGYAAAAFHVLLILALQVLLGLPFLLTHPYAYVTSAYNLGRHFLFKWTVNWRFLDPVTFDSVAFHRILMAAHLLVLVTFAFWRWTRPRHSFAQLLLSNRDSLRSFLVKPKAVLNPKIMCHMLFTCNLVGIMFSRTLHYQFYSWYYYSLPLLLWSTPYSTSLRLLIWGCIELCWNTYPSTVFSSLLLHVAHAVLFVGLCLPPQRVQRLVTVPMKID